MTLYLIAGFVLGFVSCWYLMDGVRGILEHYFKLRITEWRIKSGEYKYDERQPKG